MRPCSKKPWKTGDAFKGAFGCRDVRFEGMFALNGFGRWSFFGKRARRKRTEENTLQMRNNKV